MTSEYLINHNGTWYHGSADNYPTTHISTLFEEKSIEQQLEEAEAKVDELKKQIEERDKPKIGDVCKFWDDYDGRWIISKLKENCNSNSLTYSSVGGFRWKNAKKLTQQEVIDLLFRKIKKGL